MKTIKFTFLLVWFCFLPELPFLRTCTHLDYDALAILYNSTNGDRGRDCLPCDRYRVGCDTSGQVDTIDLSEYQMADPVPYSFAQTPLGNTACPAGTGDVTVNTAYACQGTTVTVTAVGYTIIPLSLLFILVDAITGLIIHVSPDEVTTGGNDGVYIFDAALTTTLEAGDYSIYSLS